MEKESVVQHFLKDKVYQSAFFPCIMNVSVRKKCEQEDAMGRFLNPGNEAFSEVIHSEIYVDKTPLLEYTNKVISTTSKIYLQQPSQTFLESRLQRRCCQHTTARAVIPEHCLQIMRFARLRLLKNI